MRPYFDYDPANDNLIPCREAGMAFTKGDILQIVNREDPNWWQVRGLSALEVRFSVVEGLQKITDVLRGRPVTWLAALRD